MTKKYKSEAIAALHQTVADLHKIGLVNKTTMREFDASCLTHVPTITAAEVKRIRKAAGVSQRVFGQYIGVGSTVISQWERNIRKPSGPARKLLSLAKKKGLAAIA